MSQISVFLCFSTCLVCYMFYLLASSFTGENFNLSPDMFSVCLDVLSCYACTLCFATHNCHNFSLILKLKQLGPDIKYYRLDFLARQKTRCRERPQPVRMAQCSTTLHRLRGGIAFVEDFRLQAYLQSSKSISDRVVVVVKNPSLMQSLLTLPLNLG